MFSREIWVKQALVSFSQNRAFCPNCTRNLMIRSFENVFELFNKTNVNTEILEQFYVKQKCAVFPSFRLEYSVLSKDTVLKCPLI
jgi:hypothetical protein